MKEIPLSKGKVAIVDNEDFEWLNQWKWHCLSPGYAARHNRICEWHGKRKMVLMHREVLHTPEGMCTDHINGDKLDNRHENLRICDHSKNGANAKARNGKSGYRGVCWHKQRKKWTASIRFNYKTNYLGLFVNLIDAAKAYDKKAKELFGEFANLNFPEGE